MVLLALAAAAALTIAPTHVTLAFAPAYTVSATVQRLAVAEAAAIWSPGRVVIEAANPASPACHDDVVLTVAVSAVPVSPDSPWQAPLGAVDFDAAGTPATLITVFLDRLIRMLEGARLWNVPATQWPQGMHDQVIGRAVGRVIAHEIGHVLSGSKQHTEHGLMRAIQRADELVEPGRHAYGLGGVIPQKSTRGGR